MKTQLKLIQGLNPPQSDFSKRYRFDQKRNHSNFFGPLKSSNGTASLQKRIYRNERIFELPSSRLLPHLVEEGEEKTTKHREGQSPDPYSLEGVPLFLRRANEKTQKVK
jgi:hypothetical protein